MNTILKKQISQLPRTSGVYLFKDSADEILYIGKAVSLRDRVRSYLSLRLAEERGFQMVEMVKRIKMVEIEETRYELEALLLEAKLIRQHKPPYNIRLRDDKSFAAIAIDNNLEYPTVTIKREAEIEQICQKLGRERRQAISQKLAGIEYFGPYPSTLAVKRTLRSIRRIFPFCDCSRDKFRRLQKSKSPCFNYYLHLCPGASIEKISATEYKNEINKIKAFLRGERTSLIRDLERQMKKKIAEMDFEAAARLRDQIFALSKIQMQTRIAQGKKKEERIKNKVRLLRIEAFDVSNISGQYAVGAMVVGFYDLKNKNFKFAKQFYRRFKIRTVFGTDDLAMMKEVLTRRFRHLADGSEDWARPNLIFIDGGRAHLRVARQKTDQEISIIAVAKGRSRKKVDLYYDQKIRIPIDQSELVKIAEKMREEAHRFAIGYYRTLHRKGVVGKNLRK